MPGRRVVARRLCAIGRLVKRLCMHVRRVGAAVLARVARRGAAASRSLPGRHVVADQPYVPGQHNVADRGICVLHDAIAPGMRLELVAQEPLAVRPEVVLLEKPAVWLEVVALDAVAVRPQVIAPELLAAWQEVVVPEPLAVQVT